MTDLRDQLATVDARLVIRLTDRRGIGHILWRLRRLTTMSPDGLAFRLGLSRAGLYRREARGQLPASALIDHARALGYDLALIPREDA